MTSLQQKLEQLNLTTMSQQLEPTLAEAGPAILASPNAWKLWSICELEARSPARRGAPLQAAPACTPSLPSTASTSTITSRVSRLKNRILRLLDLDFIDQGTSVCIIGNPGVGKTFLAKIIGWRACQANQRVLFTTAMDMLNHLLASQVDHSLVRKLKLYTEPALLLIDELGYLSLDQQTSNLFYQVISTRHGHQRSTLITTNTAFSDWGNILYNTTIATAIADRLVENSEIFLLGGESLRKAQQEPVRRRNSHRRRRLRHAPLCDDIPAGGVRRVTPQRRCRQGREPLRSRSLVFSHAMFNFSANHLLLLSRMEYPNLCRVPHARPLHPPGLPPLRLHPSPRSSPQASTTACAGKVNSADKLYLVIESVKHGHQARRGSTVPVPADGAGGLPLR